MKFKDNSKNKERSIFPDILRVEGNAKSFNILNEIEILSSRADEACHGLLRDNSSDNAENTARNNIADLVKMGYKLPDVDSPEKMLYRDETRNEVQHNEDDMENSPYRMVNLISKNFRLPDIRCGNRDDDFDENFLR